jgi:ATP-dependent RNA helicase DeaD
VSEYNEVSCINAKGFIISQVTSGSSHLTLGERALDRFFEHFAFSIAGAQKTRGKQMNKFRNLGLNDSLLKSIKRLGFTQPTKIQNDSIPLILQGKDVIGESETGSGKTLAFGCGIVDKVIRSGGIQALILTPTRELAEQVKNSLKELTFKPRLNIFAIYGGVSIFNQIKCLRHANVVVATPGRLLDHIQRGTIDLDAIKILVIDEADRMFDMGFAEDVEKIINECPEKRQTMFFSATISREVKDLANKHMVDPKIILAGNIVDPKKLTQVSINVSRNKKFSLLTHILKQEDKHLTMVFCNTRNITDFVHKNLCSNRINAAAIHGGLTQNMRLKTINLFNSSKVNVLVCTDVAARGLHIKNVSHIINYDLPRDPNDYIHRIGRTARAGESGQVINLLTDYDEVALTKIKKLNHTFNIENLELTEFKEVYVTKIKTDVGRGRRNQTGRNYSGQNRGGNNSSHKNFHRNNKPRNPYKKKGYGQKPRSGGSWKKGKKSFNKGSFKYKQKGSNVRRK